MIVTVMEDGLAPRIPPISTSPPDRTRRFAVMVSSPKTVVLPGEASNAEVPDGGEMVRFSPLIFSSTTAPARRVVGRRQSFRARGAVVCVDVAGTGATGQLTADEKMTS